jgi:hypothetical protein
MAVGMNSTLTAAALLILCTSMKQRGEIHELTRYRPRQTGLELETGLSIPKSTAWEQLPDLEFKSEPVYLAKKKQRMFSQITMLDQASDDIITPVGPSCLQRSLIGLGIRKSVQRMTPRNSRSSSTKSLRGSQNEAEIWGITEALAEGRDSPTLKDLPPLPEEANVTVM